MVNLSDSVRRFCSRAGLALNTDLGQHFLIDESVLEDIMGAANVQKSDLTVEIGPGIGILTRELLQKTDRLTVIEIDKRLIPLLRERTADLPASATMRITEGNALHVPMPDEPYKIVANIPYHITSPLFRHVLLESPVRPSSMTLLIQKEVAQRICSQEDASMLYLIVNIFGTPRYVRTVKPECFLPPPAVDSAVLHVDCFDVPLAQGKVLSSLFVLAKASFARKRKKLRNSVTSLPGAAPALEESGIDADRRPQDLSVSEWVAFAEAYERCTSFPT